MGEIDARVIAHATSHGGVLTRAEALALGMSPRTLTRRVAEGAFLRLGTGLLGLPGVMESEQSILRAATAALDGVASHQSAARLLGIDGLRGEAPTVSVPIRRSNRFEAVRVHQLTDLQQAHVTEVNAIPTTTPVRTVVDLAAVLSPRLLASTADQAVRQGLTDYEEIADLHRALARRGKPGVKNLRAFLTARLGGNFTSDSVLESRLFALIVGGGLPTPATQFRPEWLRRVNGRVDLAYVDDRLIIEGDSRRWHGSPEAFQLDRQRDNLAQIAGWTILRFTWDDITKRPDYVLDTISRALARY